MIVFDGVSVTYPDAAEPALVDVNLTVPEGEMCLVVGSTGVGKSTLLGAINGHVPHFTGGTLSGRVTVDGLDTRDHPPRELAGTVAVVVQDPISGFVTEIVEDELAYGMEQLGIAPATMRKRVEETLDLLGIADLRHRPMRSLSGGQQQRVAIASVLTAHPRVLVLDEPTSALDPAAAEDVLAALTRLVHDLGMTVVLAEHRLERVVEYADLVVSVDADRRVRIGAPAEMMRTTDVAPPVVRLAQAVGWEPLPLSVRDARRNVTELRSRLDDIPALGPSAASTPRPVALDASGVVVTYGRTVAVAGVDLTVRQGDVIALMGRNGSGKTSLLWALQGSVDRRRGSVTLGDGGTGRDPASMTPAERIGAVGLVPQTPSDLLYLSSVAEECAAADETVPSGSASCAELLERIVPGIDRDAHPRDLSEGQRLGLALAVQLSAAPSAILLDEPTRGLDESAKRRLAELISELANGGRCVVVATHDVEFVAQVATRVVVLADGEVVADGATAEVVMASPVFAPQVAKVLRPVPLLTVADVVDALDREVQS
ncbi:ABC transporter ATP-binding protein [Ilumatobacter sp.]|uniref:ABC transporter ATP-binding protein n=1 Tax=Ilumatobacter sp. TaxID=1967498 RepID=UPI003C714CF2